MNGKIDAALQLFVMHDFFMLGASVWAIGMIIRLWRGAPDTAQRLVWSCLAFSLVLFVVSYVMRITGIERFEWEVFTLAALPMQYAWIISLFRQSQRQAEESCKRSQAGLAP